MPIPATFHGRFTAVVDGGSLEHVFNFPAAIKNCMEMVEVGGHLLAITPVNNMAGHGFYQFSPELFFRILSAGNGFVVDRILLAEVRPRPQWYRVIDPAVAGHRVEFKTGRPAYLYIQARRVGDGPILATPPMQSDYSREWQQRERPGGTEDSSLTTAEVGTLPPPSGHYATGRFAAVPSWLLPLVRRTARLLPDSVQRALYLDFRHKYDPRFFEPLGRSLVSDGDRAS
jgi:hypothetical protein